MTKPPIGQFLDRAIHLLSYEDLDLDSTTALVPHATTLVVCSLRERSDTEAAIRTLLRLEALSIAVTGDGADEFFDFLLQSQRPAKRHTMTGNLSGGDASSEIYDFLNSTYPVEERFGEWQSYVVVSPQSRSTDIAALLRSACTERFLGS